MRFVFPSIATMIFLSTYSIIDGFFVSNYVGDRAFAAINLIFPAQRLISYFLPLVFLVVWGRSLGPGAVRLSVSGWGSRG